MIDLTPLGSTFSLKAGVVSIALTHAGKVVACGTNTLGFEVINRVGLAQPGIIYLPYHQR